MYLEKKGIEKLQNGILYYKKFMKWRAFDIENYIKMKNKTTVSVEPPYTIDCWTVL
jgi:hypothetical protein